MSLSVEDGGLPPKSVVQDEDSILADSARLIDRFHDPDPLAMTQIALAPCSPFSVTRGLMQASAELARARGVLLHTHLAETEDENAFCEATFFGCRPPIMSRTAAGWRPRPGTLMACTSTPMSATDWRAPGRGRVLQPFQHASGQRHLLGLRAGKSPASVSGWGSMVRPPTMRRT